MLAVNYSTIRNKLKEFCDKVTDDYETVIVTRKGEKNVVIISLEEYNSIMKAVRNAVYLDKIDRSLAQIDSGNVVTRTIAELEERNVSDITELCKRAQHLDVQPLYRASHRLQHRSCFEYEPFPSVIHPA